MLGNILLWISGLAAGFGLAFTSTGTRTGNGIAGMAYIGAVLVGALALMVKVG